LQFEAQTFYPAVLAAGAILMGFCGTFLAFRIQREADYYRQAVPERRRDKYIGLTHFTSSLVLLLLAAASAMVFGFIIPLFTLSGILSTGLNARIVVGGLTATSVLIAGYFTNELVHYHVFRVHLVNDKAEWRRELPVLAVTLLLGIGLLLLILLGS